MSRIAGLWKCTLAAALAAGTAATAAAMEVRVVDPEGEPVADARVMIKTEGNMSTWMTGRTDESGTADVTVHDHMYNSIDAMRVLAAAPGFAFGEVRLTDDFRNAEPEVSLRPGRDVKLTFNTPEAMVLPDDALVFATNGDLACFSVWTMVNDADANSSRVGFAPAPAARTDAGEWTVTLPEDSDEHWYAGLMAPGVLELWWSGTEAASIGEAGAIGATFDLEQPGSLAAVTQGPEEGDYWMEVSTSIDRVEDGSCGVRLREIEVSGHDRVNLSIKGLAPGNYRLEGGTGLLQTRWQQSNQSYKDQARVEVASGERATARLEVKEVPEDFLAGQFSMTAALVRQDGTPAAGLGWKLTHFDHNTGYREVATGTTDEKGHVTLKDLAGGPDGPEFTLSTADGTKVADVRLTGTKDIKRLRLPPVVGDKAPDFTVMNIRTNEPMSLSDLRGQVVFVDFWATWCGPCQDPMEKNSTVLEKRAKDWEGKATIMAVSSDDKREKLEEHLAAKGWENILNTWAFDPSGWNNEAFNAYNVTGIPTAVLIDQEGTIVWRGHPFNYDVESEIDKLLESGPAAGG